jgi:D-lactate dehydrogenase
VLQTFIDLHFESPFVNFERFTIQRLLNDSRSCQTSGVLRQSRRVSYWTKALIAALKSGHLAGVALDVYEEEEGVFFEDLSGQVLQDDELARLLTFPNVLITAHQAFLTREALSDIARTTIANLQAFAEGKPLVEGSVLT